jgi:hypothetical protein
MNKRGAENEDHTYGCVDGIIGHRMTINVTSASNLGRLWLIENAMLKAINSKPLRTSRIKTLQRKPGIHIAAHGSHGSITSPAITQVGDCQTSPLP